MWRYYHSNLEYLHSFWTEFEHEFALGGGSGHSGGIFPTLEVVTIP
jgi:hypothetical protein